jgi:hypothetical protein
MLKLGKNRQKYVVFYENGKCGEMLLLFPKGHKLKGL